MKSRDIIGRTIKQVKQVRFFDQEARTWKIKLESLVLDDGSFISFHAEETEELPVVTATVVKPAKE